MKSSGEYLSLLKGSGLYWLLQILGWGGMITLEIINYTFFIVGTFASEYLVTFSLYAFIGLLVTHLSRLVLARFNVFSKPSLTIWTIGILSTVICSFVSVGLLILPSVLLGDVQDLAWLTPIYVMGLVMNNGRYILIWMVIYFLYKIMEQRNLDRDEKYQATIKAKNFELELLKRQINPHFLFNALNSIKAMVLIQPETSRDAIIRLSELLRYTLNYEHKQLVTIEDELVEVRKYFDLEKMRYGKRFEVEYSISDTVKEEFIPAVLLLTLAENAIKHGVSRNPEKTEIKVVADGNEHGYFVSVFNTGKLWKQNGSGIGLRHITRSLEEHYGDAANFTLGISGDGITAKIEIIQDGYKNTSDRRRTAGISRAESIAQGS